MEEITWVLPILPSAPRASMTTAWVPSGRQGRNETPGLALAKAGRFGSAPSRIRRERVGIAEPDNLPPWDPGGRVRRQLDGARRALLHDRGAGADPASVHRQHLHPVPEGPVPQIRPRPDDRGAGCDLPGQRSG